MNDNKCPCKECICLSICRLKKISNLFDECVLVNTYTTNWASSQLKYNNKLIELSNVLNSPLWDAREGRTGITLLRNKT